MPGQTKDIKNDLIEEEKRLEKLLFGKSTFITDVLEESSLDQKINEVPITPTCTPPEQYQLFFVDTAPAVIVSTPEPTSKKSDAAVAGDIHQKRKAAWVDDDDELEKDGSSNSKDKEKKEQFLERIDITKPRLRKLRKDINQESVTPEEYEALLRNQFAKLHPVPSWVESAQEANVSAGDMLLRSAASILDDNRNAVLQPEVLDVWRLKNANQNSTCNSVVREVQFHPSKPLLFTAGLDKYLRFFEIDGKLNTFSHKVFFENFPISNAKFSPDGKEVIVTSSKCKYFIYNVESQKVTCIPRLPGGHFTEAISLFEYSPFGKYLMFLETNGHITILLALSKRFYCSFKMNGGAESATFSSDGNTLYSIGRDSIVYEWDLPTKKCIKTFTDVGSHNPICIALSPNDDYLATGSESGVVNIYKKCHNEYKFQKSIMNLTTAVTGMKFNHDSQILCIWSKFQIHSLKMIHLSSLTVFKNWPTKKTPLGYVNSVDFSPASGYIAIGNDKGLVVMYHLKHYPSPW